MFRPTGTPPSTAPMFERDEQEMDWTDAPKPRHSTSALADRAELWGLPTKALSRVESGRDLWGGKRRFETVHTAPGSEHVPKPLLPAFGGLAVEDVVGPEPGLSINAAALSARELPRRARAALSSRLARESAGVLAPSFQLTFGLAGGETVVSVPIARQSPRDERLESALRLEPVSPIREHHGSDGSFAVAYETLIGSGNGERWLVALQVDPNRNLRRAAFYQARGGTGAPGEMIGDFRFDKNWSPLETLPPELMALVTRHLSTDDLDSLARTSSTMTEKVEMDAKVASLLAELAESTLTIDDLNRTLTNCARDARLRDFYPIGRLSESIAEDPIANTRLTQREKGRLFETLAQRVAVLDTLHASEYYEPYEGEDDDPTVGHFSALARLMLLDANERLKPADRGDLSALESGAAFSSPLEAAEAGVPLSTVKSTFRRGDDDELLEAARGAAKVLIRTGSTWEEAADALGFPKDHARCYELKWLHESMSFIPMLALKSVEELESRLDELGIGLDNGDDTQRRTMVAEWEIWHGRGATQRLVEGERAADVYADVYGQLDEGENLFLAMHEAEIFQVTHLAPAMIEKGCTAEQVIEGLDIRHPVACHFARRFHAKALAGMENNGG